MLIVAQCRTFGKIRLEPCLAYGEKLNRGRPAVCHSGSLSLCYALLRRVCEVPRYWNRRRRRAAPERSRAAFTGVFDVAVTGHMSDMPCRARLHRGYGAPGTDGHGRAMPEKCRSKVSEKWPLKLHPAFSVSGSALKGHSRICESVSGSHLCRALLQPVPCIGHLAMPRA